MKIHSKLPFHSLKIALAACLFLSINAQANTDRVGTYLTWKSDPTSTMTINWVNLYEHTATTVWYRERGKDEWRSEEGSHHQLNPSVLQVRRVTLEHLESATAYEFYIGAEQPAEDQDLEWFRTMPKELDRPLRFVTGGDMMHNRKLVDAMNERAGILDPDFALLGGDFAYANGVNASRWVDWLQSWTTHARGKQGRHIPFVVVIGNHEVRGYYDGRIPDDAPYFYGLFPLPENRSYYALDFADYLTLIVLDSGHTHKISGPQENWLARALTDRSTQQFLFPAYHYPAYGTTKAAEGKLPSENERSIEIQQTWIPHFERHGVTAVFEYDHHNYKRTHRILNNQRDDERGLLFLGDGAWGVRTRDVPAPGAAWYLAHAESRRHLYLVTLHPDGHADFDAIDARGEVFDEVSIDQPRTAPIDSTQ